MDYEQDDVFPNVSHDPRGNPPMLSTSALAEEDLVVLMRLHFSHIAGLFPTGYRDYSISCALARARAKGVMPKMQPLAVFLENAGKKQQVPLPSAFAPEL